MTTSSRALLTLAALAPTPLAAAPDARAIMEKVENRETGERMTADMEMILDDGATRTRKLRSFSRRDGDTDRIALFFTEPADVKGTGFLTWDARKSGKDDDQWLYLPALKRVRRIAAADRTGSFMGSDFSYADMTQRDLDDFNFEMVKEDMVDGAKVWQIRATPRSDAVKKEIGYEKSVLMVRQDNHVVVRAVNWLFEDPNLKLFEVKRLERIDGIWVPTETIMATRKGDKVLHKTTIRLSNVKIDAPISDALFTAKGLETGP